VRLELSSDGRIIIDTNVTGRVQRGNDYEFMNSMVIAEEDIKGELRKIFAYSLSLFGYFDPYCRYDRFIFNAALSNIGNRILELNPQTRKSYQMGTGTNEVVIAFDKPRTITRSDLTDSNREIEAVITIMSIRLITPKFSS
jgi:hypothetical protein